MPKQLGRFNRHHRHGDPLHPGNGGGGNGGGNQGGPNLGDLSDVNQVASGHQLVQLARAMARTELHPQISAYRRLVAELKKQEGFDTTGLERLGTHTEKDIAQAAQAYDTGAEGAAQRTQMVGDALGTQLAAQGKAAAAEQQTAQTGTLGGLTEGLQLQGAPQGGAAQAALADLVSQQSARQALETQASGQFAASQQGSYGGLLEGMRTAGGLQASTASQGIARDIASRIAEQRLQAGQDIREAEGKKADVKATRGATILEKLAQLRSDERDFLLGKRATKTTQRGQDLQAQSAAASLAETTRAHQASEATAQQNADTASQNAQNGQQGSGAARDNRQQAATDRRDAIAAARDLASTGQHAGDLGYLQKHFAAYVDEIQNRTGVPYAVARRMALKYIKHQTQRQGGGSTSGGGSGSGGHPGPTAV